MLSNYDAYLEAPFQAAEASHEKVLDLIDKAVEEPSLLEEILNNEPNLIRKTAALLQSLMKADEPDKSVTDFMETVCENHLATLEEPDFPELAEIPDMEEALDTLYPDSFFQQQTNTFGPIPDKYKRLAETRLIEQKSEGGINCDS